MNNYIEFMFTVFISLLVTLGCIALVVSLVLTILEITKVIIESRKKK